MIKLCNAGYNACVKEITLTKETFSWCQSALSGSTESVRDISLLKAEASHRSFYRITTEKRSLILMESPPQKERNDLFIAIGAAFFAHQIPVASLIAHEESSGRFLMTDLGAADLESHYGKSSQNAALKAAIDLLPKVATASAEHIAPYTKERMHEELHIFYHWFMVKMLGLSGYQDTFDGICEILVDDIDAQPTCCIHRDYHCRNVLYNQKKLGIVDFQDALRGPLMYDIASLLRDCYYTFEESQVDSWLAYFMSITPALTNASFTTTKQRFDWTAIQRQLKAIVIFARLHLRDGKTTHLRYIAPVLDQLLDQTRRYPELHALPQVLTRCAQAFEFARPQTP